MQNTKKEGGGQTTRLVSVPRALMLFLEEHENLNQSQISLLLLFPLPCAVPSWKFISLPFLRLAVREETVTARKHIAYLNGVSKHKEMDF